MAKQIKIALGGGCHWCTEAVFQSLFGVIKVEQGFVSSIGEYSAFSEAVIVHFDTEKIALQTLIEIHLHTHKSTSNHSMREKYRSAIYTYSSSQMENAKRILNQLHPLFDNKIITKVCPFSRFKPSRKAIQNYYKKNPNKPFCETFIKPKLKLLIEHYSEYVNEEKVSHLKTSIP